jgi:hypothetical protein
MSRSEELRELLARVEMATGGDRETDASIHEILGWQDRPPGFRIHSDLPEYTRSVDAAFALITRALPGWVLLNLGREPAFCLWYCLLYSFDLKQASEVNEIDGGANAIVAAVLSALIAQKDPS